MGTLLQSDAQFEAILPGRSRYLVYTDHLMMAVIDFNDGPHVQPDAPHTHPHEQVSYVAEGEILFFENGKPTHLHPGDLFHVAAHVPHNVQCLTPHARVIDTFSPIREDFLKP